MGAGSTLSWDSGPTECVGCGSSKRYVKIRSVRMVNGEREPLCKPCFFEAVEEGQVDPDRAQLGWGMS